MEENDIDKSKENMIVKGDNYEFLKYLFLNGYKNKVDMIYIDPPFFSKADYKVNIKKNVKNLSDIATIEHEVYTDKWKNGAEDYIESLVDKLVIMKELLSDTGVIFLHLDWHIVHYMKVVMDEIFGEENFINEIVWTYKSGGAGRRHYSRKHDTILLYGKTKKYKFNIQKEKSYNRQYKPYRFKGVEEFEDELGWYTNVNMKDVWNIDMVGRTSGERVGYATQKPEKLLERMILGNTDENDLCIDLYGGSGTTAAVAEKNNRRWIVNDIGNVSIMTNLKRMTSLKSKYNYYELDYKNRGNSNLKYKINISEENGNKNVEIELIEYKYIDIEKVAINKKYSEALKSMIETDSLQLLEYVAIDTNYNKENFKPNIKNIRSKGIMSNSISFTVKDSDTIAIRTFDAFGYEFFKQIKI